MSPSPIDFLHLPCEIRNSIYKRVLAVAHPIFLFQDTGSQVVETFAPDRPKRWLALLYTNRQIHIEASAVLYGSNQFYLEDSTRHQVELLQSFLACIGSVKAGLLSHLCINLPVAETIEDQPGKVMLREDGLQSLKLLQEKCSNLTTLETLVHDRNSRGLVKVNHENWQLVRERLSRIDAELKVISSLHKVIVRFYCGHPAPSAMELMQGFGWVVLTV